MDVLLYNGHEEWPRVMLSMKSVCALFTMYMQGGWELLRSVRNVKEDKLNGHREFMCCGLNGHCVVMCQIYSILYI